MLSNGIERTDEGPFRRTSGVVDCVVASLVSLVGLVVVTVGVGLLNAVDPAAVGEVVERFAVQSELFSDAQLVELGTTVADWSGVGAVVTGGLLVLVGAGFLLHRLLGSNEGGETERIATGAAYGAAVTAALSFVPGSPVLGGAAAGYLQGDRGSGTAAGAVSGAASAVPALLLVGFVFVGITNGLATVGAAAIATLVGLVGMVALSVLLAFSTVMGALGGAVGGRFDGRPV